MTVEGQRQADVQRRDALVPVRARTIGAGDLLVPAAFVAFVSAHLAKPVPPRCGETKSP